MNSYNISDNTGRLLALIICLVLIYFVNKSNIDGIEFDSIKIFGIFAAVWVVLSTLMYCRNIKGFVLYAIIGVIGLGITKGLQYVNKGVALAYALLIIFTLSQMFFDSTRMRLACQMIQGAF